jgi:hypothetical protein
MQNVKKIVHHILMLAVLVLPNFAFALVDTGLETTNNQIAGGTALGTPGTAGGLSTKLGSLIGIILSFTGAVFFILMVYAGFTWMTAQGNQADVDKAKKTMTAAIIGLIFVLSAYAITSFIGTSVST